MRADRLREVIMMETDINKLDQICSDIAGVAMGLMDGTVEFSYDNLMSTMKPGHPCEIMDEIFQDVYFSVVRKIEPPIEKLEITLKDLIGFKKAFKVKELNKPLTELAEYINARKE